MLSTFLMKARTSPILKSYLTLRFQGIQKIFMANLEVAVPHNLSQEEALNRIRNMFTQMKQEHGDKISNLKEEWNGNVGNFSFTAQGFDVAGTLTVNPSNVEFNGKIPFTLSLFKGAIVKTIEQQATKILS